MFFMSVNRIFARHATVPTGEQRRCLGLLSNLLAFLVGCLIYTQRHSEPSSHTLYEV